MAEKFQQYHKTDKKYNFDTELLHKGAYINAPDDHPEAMPIYLTTAHDSDSVYDLMDRYDRGAFCYNRNRNANRMALAELCAAVDNGKGAVVCPSGMSAIFMTVSTLVKAGDHILSDKTLYGEVIPLFADILGKFGVEVTFIDFTDKQQVIDNTKENTVLYYCETTSNPMCMVVDLKWIADYAHERGIKFAVDNTFMTPVAVKPLDFGVDYAIYSLTKFMNGHSDAVAGVVVSNDEKMIAEIHEQQVLTGSVADAFSSYLCARGMRTLDLRLKKQMANATALAELFANNKHVKKVYHPSRPDHPQHELASKQFQNGYGAMMSVEFDCTRDQLNAFMEKLNLCHYAGTLGGFRTTMAQPWSSSHENLPEEERIALGITYGLVRFSVGTENIEDLVADFTQALEELDK